MEFKPRSWAQEPQDLAKEYTDWENAQTAQEALPDKPEEFSKSLVRRGIIDPRTGLQTGNSKQKHISSWVPSERFKMNYDRVFSK